MKKTFLLLVLVFLSGVFFAQSNLYMSQEFTKAYNNQTRSKDGYPGENNFANHSDYTIEADFNPGTGILIGSETVIYHNESPDTLNMMIIRLYQNLFKKGNPRDFGVNLNDVSEGVKITKFIISGIELKPEKLRIYSTNIYLKTPDAINPNSTVKLEIEWEIQYPQTAFRNGKYGENTWFIGYWYPQIAVYDDVFGWDKNTYTGATEFYNDHSNFDVKITVPAPNLLWATGELQNIDEVYSSKYSKRIKNAQISDNVVNIITPKDYAEGKILKNNDKNTWHYVASKVPDFSFSTSDKHNWDGVSILIPYQDNKVFISGVYMDSTENFHQLAQFTRDIISEFSFKIPAIPFPYPAMTVFEGGGAMEYPMMVNEQAMSSLCDDYSFTAHEVGHSYFPFFTGSNETRFAWMDEGLVSYFPRLVTDELLSDCNIEQKIIDDYSKVAGNTNDLPLMTPTNTFKDFFAYNVIAYDRSAFALYQLHLYLGDELFYASLQEYAKRWANKHPYPYDFFYTFEDVSQQDLSWIWKPFFFEFTKPNLALTDVKFEGGLYFSVENIGEMPLPIEISITLSDGRIQKVVKKNDCWKDKNVCEFYIPMDSEPKMIKLGNKTVPDVDESDNVFEFN